MSETANPQEIPTPPLALIVAVVAASCLTGGTLVLFESELALAIVRQLLSPGPDALITVGGERSGGIYHFRLELFYAGSLFIAIPLMAAWVASTGYRQYARTVVILFVFSILLSSAAFFLYRQLMQVQLTDFRLGGQLQPPRSRGSWTPLGEVPIAKLTLSGPVLASAFVLIRRRRIVKSALKNHIPL